MPFSITVSDIDNKELNLATNVFTQSKLKVYNVQKKNYQKQLGGKKSAKQQSENNISQT